MDYEKEKIYRFIKRNKTLKELDFLSVYLTISELIASGKMGFLQNV